MRRVVITGIGLVTPLASGAEATWKAVLAGKSGIGRITRFDASELTCQVAGEVPYGDGADEFRPDDWVVAKDQKKMGLFILYAIAAAEQAVRDSGWVPADEEEKYRTGVMIGSGIGGIDVMEDTITTMVEKGPRRVSPFFIPACLINLASGHVSIKHGFKGPNHSVVTACATGAHAIGDASAIIARGDADVMVAGGAEAAICKSAMAGFAAARALSSGYNDAPESASRPWDKGRDGFVMGEGAGIVVLEEYEHAKKRGAKIYAEVVGYGLSGDAYHITAPSADGDGGFRAMKMALEKAGIEPEQVDYVNAHGTSTPMGDEIEIGAIKRLFGDAAYKTSISSTKSAIGHLLGAAGSVEAIFCALAIRDGMLPPTLNLQTPSESCDLDLVPLKAKPKQVKIALSNSFGFGGTNAALVLKAV